MFKYDSVHGNFKGTVEQKDGKLWIQGKPIAGFGEREEDEREGRGIGEWEEGEVTL